MIPRFDIFRVDSDGPRWLEAAADLEGARARVNLLATASPGEYLIANHETGEKISIKPKTKRILFQIGYEAKGLNARAELLRRFGHEVISVTNNEAAQKRNGRLAEGELSKGQNCGAESVQGPTRRRRSQRHRE